MIEYENLKLKNEAYLEEFKQIFASTLDSGWYILGKNVDLFEKEFANYLGVKHCVGVASGLDALLLALKAYDFPLHSEVIVPSNTYVATILAILHAGLKPVLIEPDLKSYNISPLLIEEKITKKTVAMMVVHLYGKSCNMDPILSLCQNHNLKLIEDCAQSHGAKYKGKMTGSFGDIGAFSFYPTKNLGALGDAGALTFNNSHLQDKIRCLRNYGSSQKYFNELIGYNSRLDEIQAGFLSLKLKSLDKINDYKRSLAKIYFNNLKEDFILPQIDPDTYDIYHIFNIRHEKRDKLREYMLNNGVKTEIHYPIPPHKQQALKDLFKNEDFPISSEIHNTTLSLPISSFHKGTDIYKVIEVMNKF